MRLPPDLAGSFGEPDDDAPPRRTVPETPAPGERFMERHGCLWSVFDWAGVTCPCYGRHPGEEGVRADPSCGICGGTGESHLEPEEVAGGLAEADARLLCFGGELVKALEAVEAAINHYSGCHKCGADLRGNVWFCHEYHHLNGRALTLRCEALAKAKAKGG